MTAVDYATLIVHIAQASKHAETIVRAEYKKSLSVFVGFPQDRKNFETAAPYAMALPMGENSDAEAKNYSVSLEIGLYDERLIMKDGVEILSAYDVFSHLVPVLELDISDQLRGARPTVHVQTLDVRYNQTAFPLITAVMTFEIAEPIPMGRWRVL